MEGERWKGPRDYLQKDRHPLKDDGRNNIYRKIAFLIICGQRGGGELPTRPMPAGKVWPLPARGWFENLLL